MNHKRKNHSKRPRGRKVSRDEYEYDADYDESSNSESSTDEEEERDESSYFFSRGRSREELNFILKHALKHPPNISVEEFVCALCYDRLSNRWTKLHENMYQRIIKILDR